MISEKEQTRISKFLSLVLRHHPERIGMQLDPQGWADVNDLLEKAKRHGVPIDSATLNYIVATNTKKRFAFNETLNKIRASQGHSIPIELGYYNQEPPEILFHGTGEKAVPSIWERGLEKRTRQHVHLSPDIATARKVGQRHGKPFVFKVLAKQMYTDNFTFFLADNGVWLTDNVPVKYLHRLDE